MFTLVKWQNKIHSQFAYTLKTSELKCAVEAHEGKQRPAQMNGILGGTETPQKTNKNNILGFSFLCINIQYSNYIDKYLISTNIYQKYE